MTNYKEEVYETFRSGLESNGVIAALNGYDEKGMEKELDEVYRKAKAYDQLKELVKSKTDYEEFSVFPIQDDYDYGRYKAYENLEYIMDYFESEDE